jgi:hypothetical protein
MISLYWQTVGWECLTYHQLNVDIMKCLLCAWVCVCRCGRGGSERAKVKLIRWGADIHQATFHHNALHCGGRMILSVGLEQTSCISSFFSSMIVSQLMCSWSTVNLDLFDNLWHPVHQMLQQFSNFEQVIAAYILDHLQGLSVHLWIIQTI